MLSFPVPIHDHVLPQRHAYKESLPIRLHQLLMNRLFLLLRLLVGLGLGALLALADQAGLGASVAELAVGVLGGWVVADLALLDDNLVVDRESLVGVLDATIVADLLASLDLLLGGVASLWRLGLAWEEHQALLVGLQALDIGLEGLLGEVLAAWVNGDTDGWRELAWDASLL